MAPVMPATATKCLELMMSERLRTALISVPATKPSWTAIEIQLAWDAVSDHSLLRAGTTAEPLNQSDKQRSSAIARRLSAVHLFGWSNGMLLSTDQMRLSQIKQQHFRLFVGANF